MKGASRALLMMGTAAAAGAACTGELAVPGDVYLGTFVFKVKTPDAGGGAADAASDALPTCRGCPSDGGESGAPWDAHAPEETTASLSMDSQEDGGVHRFYFVVAGRSPRVGEIRGDHFTLRASVVQPLEECRCSVQVSELFEGFLVAAAATGAGDAGPLYQSAEASLVDTVTPADLDAGATCAAAAPAGACACPLPCALEFELAGTRR